MAAAQGVGRRGCVRPRASPPLLYKGSDTADNLLDASLLRETPRLPKNPVLRPPSIPTGGCCCFCRNVLEPEGRRHIPSFPPSPLFPRRSVRPRLHSAIAAAAQHDHAKKELRTHSHGHRDPCCNCSWIKRFCEVCDVTLVGVGMCRKALTIKIADLLLLWTEHLCLNKSSHLY